MSEENTDTEYEEFAALAQESMDSDWGSFGDTGQDSEQAEEAGVEEEETSVEEEEVEEEEIDVEDVEAELNTDEVSSDEDETNTSDHSFDPDANETLTGRSGDEEYDVPMNLEFDVKVDGQEERASLQALLDNYSGQQNWDRKNTDLQKAIHENESRVKSFNDNAQKFREMTEEGKAQEALDFLLETAGLDKNRFVNNYVSQLAPQLAEYQDMTPEERDYQRTQQEAEFYKSQVEQFKSTTAQQQATEKMRHEVQSTLENHNMSADRFEELQKELHQLSDAGKLDKSQINPAFVGQYYVAIQREELAREVLTDLNPELVKNRSALDYLSSLQTNNPEMTREKLTEAAERAFIDQTVKKVKSRVKKNAKASKAKTLAKKSRAKKEDTKTTTALTFDEISDSDLMDLL